MELTEKTYEEVLYKLLVLASADGTSHEQFTTKAQITAQVEDWVATNAPIGIGTLLKYARFFDNFKE